MENSISTIVKLFNNNSNNHLVIKYIEQYINKLPDLVKNINEESNNIKYTKNKENFIQKFLYSPSRQFFYIQNSNIFVVYNEINFNIISEDNIWHLIYSELNEYPLKNKIIIKNEIISQIKKNDFFKSIPESKTIQEIIKITRILFTCKDEIKYFLTVLGDNILKKKRELIHYCHINSKPFFELISQYYQDYFKNTHILNSIRFKYHGSSYKDSRIIHINKDIHNYYGLPVFMKGNFFNLISVACYYSNRYEHSEHFLNNESSKKIKNKICYIKDKTPENIIIKFISESIVISQTEQDSATKKDIFFLWNKYLNDNNLPNIIGKNNFIKILEEKLSNNFRKITNPILFNIKYIRQFWQSTIQMGDLINDELEISEFIKLFNNWCLNNNIILEDIDDDNHIIEILQYYINDIKIKDGKYILNVKCTLWSKEDDIKHFILNIKQNISNNITFNSIYKLYCKFSNNKIPKNKTIIVSKKYFEKYLNNNIPNKYIQNNNIISPDFWSSF